MKGHRRDKYEALDDATSDAALGIVITQGADNTEAIVATSRKVRESYAALGEAQAALADARTAERAAWDLVEQRRRDVERLEKFLISAASA